MSETGILRTSATSQDGDLHRLLESSEEHPESQRAVSNSLGAAAEARHKLRPIHDFRNQVQLLSVAS